MKVSFFKRDFQKGMEKCDICALPTKLHCSCGTRNYCSKACQKRDRVAHRRKCPALPEPENVVKDRFIMYLEKHNETAKLTLDGLRGVLKRTQNPEDVEFLSFLEREWRKFEYQDYFTDIVNRNELWGVYSNDFKDAKQLLRNFEGLVDPQTGRRLTKEKFETMVREWSLLEE